jgi:Mlc titration factor MtfA (ptsG expression regulator)
MDAYIVLLVIVLMVAVVLFYKKPQKRGFVPPNFRKLLQDHVSFYNALNPEEKIRFEEKIIEFLGYIHVKGVKTEVEELDRLLVAASGVIPIFGFPEWKYYNLREVLLYPYTFDHEEFLSEAARNYRDTLGMVGNGPMQRVMILSKTALRSGFENSMSAENTGIHEFVHLLDKEDGAVDGLPEALLKHQYAIPWINLMNDNIEAIKEGRSDINTYGATNKAEFFAVASEYFFKRPDLFRENHRDLYDLMTRIFHQTPPTSLPQES